jgi:hypothetical protein
VWQKANEIKGFLKKDFCNIVIETGSRNYNSIPKPES